MQPAQVHRVVSFALAVLNIKEQKVVTVSEVYSITYSKCNFQVDVKPMLNFIFAQYYGYPQTILLAALIGIWTNFNS